MSCVRMDGKVTACGGGQAGFWSYVGSWDFVGAKTTTNKKFAYRFTHAQLASLCPLPPKSFVTALPGQGEQWTITNDKEEPSSPAKLVIKAPKEGDNNAMVTPRDESNTLAAPLPPPAPTSTPSDPSDPSDTFLPKSNPKKLIESREDELANSIIVSSTDTSPSSSPLRTGRGSDEDSVDTVESVVPSSATAASSVTSPIDDPACVTPAASVNAKYIPPPPHDLKYSIDDFRDGALQYPATTPTTGFWKGHFENSKSKRKDYKVQENFSLFFNSNPQPEARTEFFTDSPLPRNDDQPLMHVRGDGTNKFGHFEILGSYDPKNSRLLIQRVYLAIPPKPKTKKPSAKRPLPQPNLTVDGLDPNSVMATTDASTHYNTRKKPMNWSKYDLETEAEEKARLKKMRVSENKQRGGMMQQKKKSSKGNLSQSESLSQFKSANCAGFNPATQHFSNKKPFLALPTVSKSKLSKTLNANVSNELNARWKAAHFVGGTNEIYEGEVWNGLRSGSGACVYACGNIFEGTWKEGREHGRGTLYTPTRDVIYEGSWAYGRMSGSGIYHFEDGSVYSGEWKENLRVGVGTYTFKDGSSYVGEWANNLMSGRGTMTWKDGSTYVGEFAGGQRHGKGRMSISDGFVHEGLWRNDAMDGRGACTYPDQSQYIGNFSKGKKEGRGSVIFANNAAVYEGRFREDGIEGQGTLAIKRNVSVDEEGAGNESNGRPEEEKNKGKKIGDYLIPITVATIALIHERSGFTKSGD